MTPYASSLLIAVAGMTALTAMTFGVTAQSAQVAAVLPPWHGDGVSRAAATGLAILDLHWGHRVIILDTGGDPDALDRLRGQGFWLLDATGTPLCDTVAERT